jgi:hypothetical protein
MTREELEKKARAAIDGAIFTASANIGRFMKGIWLFTMPEGWDDKERKTPIQGICVEVHNLETLKFSAAYARKQASIQKPDFTVLAVAAMSAYSMEEAEAKVARTIAAGGGPELYAFRVQAPGFEPFVLVQRFTRDANNIVQLQGELEIAERYAQAHSQLSAADPWAEFTEEDRELLAKGVESIHPQIITNELLISNLFNKNIEV